MNNAGELSPIPGSVGERLRLARRRRFVGRAGEIELFRAMMEAPEPPFAVLFVHGPGGIGKTSLLRAFSEISEEVGVVPAYVDARTVEPSPPGILAGLADALGLPAGESPLDRIRGGGPVVLLLDTYEVIASLDDWVRERFLPRLPAGVPVVIASRHPPPPAWVTDPGWHDLLRVVSLRNLRPEDARAYLRVEGLHHSLHDRVLELTHGHPLALSLFVDVVVQHDGPTRPSAVLDLPGTPDVVRLLLERFVEGVPNARHRFALEVCAHSRFTTEGLVRHAVGDNASELFSWLRALSFVEEGPLGLFPHDLARDVLDADLRWRDPTGYAELHRRVRTEIVQRAQSSEGVEQQRACTDMLFLHRTNPMVRPYLDWATLGQGYADVLRPADRQPILAMAERHEGSESAALVGYWMERQPHAFVVFRGAGEEATGFAALIALHHASRDDLAADPGAQAMWGYALRYGPPAPGEEVVAHRFFMDADAYQGASSSFNHWAVRCIQHIISGHRLAWSFGALADPDSVAGMFADIDYHRAPEADFEVGGRHYGVFAHDFRRVSPEAWLDLISQREIGVAVQPPASPAPSPVLALSQPEFAAAVGQALRDLHRPDRLARNPLLSCRIARDRAGGDPPVRILTGLLGEAADVLRADPRDEKLYRAVDRTYLRPAVTQERAAELLSLPFSTYRRHLTRGVERVVDWLWDQELYGAADTAHPS
jgi:hypothetical protein